MREKWLEGVIDISDCTTSRSCREFIKKEHKDILSILKQVFNSDLEETTMNDNTRDYYSCMNCSK